jgi:hypothetical protein
VVNMPKVRINIIVIIVFVKVRGEDAHRFIPSLLLLSK